MGVGVIALIVVFQQEVRRFLLVIGNRYVQNTRLSPQETVFLEAEEPGGIGIVERDCKSGGINGSEKIGALIVISRQSRLGIYAETGEIIKAQIGAELLKLYSSRIHLFMTVQL